MVTSMFPLPLVIFLLRKGSVEQALLSPRAVFYKMYIQVDFLMSRKTGKKGRKNHIQCEPNVQAFTLSQIQGMKSFKSTLG